MSPPTVVRTGAGAERAAHTSSSDASSRRLMVCCRHNVSDSFGLLAVIRWLLLMMVHSTVRRIMGA
jgi:hypothetical protein